MIISVFPITGPLKEPLLILEWIIFFLYLEAGIIFYIRVKDIKKKLRNMQERAYICFFFGYSFMRLFIIIGDFYFNAVNTRLMFYNIGYIIGMIFALLFFYRMEQYQIFFRKFLFTRIYSVVLILSIIFLFILTGYLRIIVFFLTWILTFLFVVFYMKKFASNNKIKRVQKHFNLNLLELLIGFFSIIIGTAFTIDLVVDILDLNFRLIGDVFLIVGILFVMLFFISVPTLSEYDWLEKIDSVLIMHKSGLFIYKKLFREDLSPLNDTLVSGAISIIEMALEKITSKEEVSIIEKEGKTIIIQPGKYVFGVIICDEGLNSFQILLNDFIEKIEAIYSNVLPNWDGNTKVFSPIENIANEVFL